MAVNQMIYKDAFEYSYAGKPLFTTTDTLPNLMESSWQKNTIMDNSNVYTTFNATNYPLLCGATTSSFELDYELEEGQSATDGVKHITIKRDTPYNVNLRYIYKEQTVSNNGASMGVRWTGYKENDYEILQKLLNNTNALSYSDLNVTRRWSSPYEANDSAVYLSSSYSLDSSTQTFITSINRENLFFQVSLTFGYINENNKLVKLSNVEYSDYKDWLKTDTTGFISLQGHDKCFCLEIAKLLCVNNQKDIENNNNAFVVTDYITKKNLVTGETSVLGSGSAGGNVGNSLNILCEKYNQASCYYYTAPMTSNTDTGIKVPYKRAYFLSNNFTMRAANGSTSDFTYQSVDAFSYSHTELPNFNRGFMTIPFEDTDIQPDEDDFYVNAPSYSEGDKYTIKGRTVLCATITDRSQAANEVYFYKFCISGQEVMANLSLSLIPFAVMNQSSTQNTINKNTDPDTMFVGVRENDGTVIGSYIPYIWGETEVETEFRPEDFEPIDPIPPEPVEPDTDKDGKDSGTVSPAGKVTIGATNGFVTYYALTASQIREIGKNLWGNNNPGEILKNFFYFDFSAATNNYELSYASILDYFVSLKYYPFNIPSYADTQATGEQGIRIGTGATLIDAGAVLTTTVITNPIAIIDGGTCTVPPYYNSFMDNEPIAVASLYVPFCGTTEVLLSAVTNKPLTLTYYVDMVTGCCVAVVQATSSDGVYPVAELTGVMGFDMMLTGNNHTQQLSSIVSSIRHTALSSVGSIASAIGGVGSKNPAQVLAGIGTTASSIASTAIDMPQTAALHPMTSGTSSSLASLASYHTAFIQIKRKNSLTPGNYSSTVGYIANQTKSIGGISGFTQVVNPNLSGIAATSDEIAMIRDILTSGFYA